LIFAGEMHVVAAGGVCQLGGAEKDDLSNASTNDQWNRIESRIICNLQSPSLCITLGYYFF
jgi:hypothetical protein